MGTGGTTGHQLGGPEMIILCLVFFVHYGDLGPTLPPTTKICQPLLFNLERVDIR